MGSFDSLGIRDLTELTFARTAVGAGARGERPTPSYGGGSQKTGGAAWEESQSAAPDWSLSWPTATTRSPGFSPLRISARPWTRLPVRTKVRTAVRLVLPSSSFFSVIRNTESPYSV